MPPAFHSLRCSLAPNPTEFSAASAFQFVKRSLYHSATGTLSGRPKLEVQMRSVVEHKRQCAFSLSRAVNL